MEAVVGKRSLKKREEYQKRKFLSIWPRRPKRKYGALKVTKKLKSQTVSGYSNNSNPFGLCGVLTIKLMMQAEIEKVKKRREERAIEKAKYEEEMAMLAREHARAEFHDWEKKEEEVLTCSIYNDFDIEINEPYMVFKGLTMKELEELHDDIKMHLDLDTATPIHVKFWEVRNFRTLLLSSSTL
ncbi:hypothetical protein NE237_008210 [Protea cynaroides]|uniref:Splicing factor cactin central domain-containing protein n=1 Tax=Protea cynaroides TaxID=273540 RepID=A0A9Q0KRN7_9MAGN|nr:hypothetical protein NE237_008210 [Protea cynaroides]